MPSFSSLYTVRSGLFAQRRALELVGQNVANASTVGYTRQEASFLAAEPKHVVNSAGRGVSEVDVLRYRDEFADRQFRGRNGALGYHSTRSAQLAEMEQVLGDLSDSGLRASLDSFFNGWQNLSLRPADTGARFLVIQSALEFISNAKGTFQDLVTQRENIDQAIQNKITEINSATRQIAEINKALVVGGENQEQANELIDRRDLLLDSLAKLGGTTVTQHTDGTVTVHLGSLPLVDKQFAFPIDMTVQQEADRGTAPVVSLQQFLTELTWNGTANPAKFGSGEIGALLEVRDQAIPSFMGYLDNLVRTVATEVNTRHNAGVPAGTEVDFFNIQNTWMAIDVNQAIVDDPTLILAAGTLPAQAGDGERARAIAGIRDANVLLPPPQGTIAITPGQYLRTTATLAGLMVQEAGHRNDTAVLSVQQAERQRQSVSGVSIDDEMTKMIQFQQAYNAAARTMTAIDEMLDVVINRVGLAGR